MLSDELGAQTMEPPSGEMATDPSPFFTPAGSEGKAVQELPPLVEMTPTGTVLA